MFKRYSVCVPVLCRTLQSHLTSFIVHRLGPSPTTVLFPSRELGCLQTAHKQKRKCLCCYLISVIFFFVLVFFFFFNALTNLMRVQFHCWSVNTRASNRIQRCPRTCRVKLLTDKALYTFSKDTEIISKSSLCRSESCVLI